MADQKLAEFGGGVAAAGAVGGLATNTTIGATAMGIAKTAAVTTFAKGGLVAGTAVVATVGWPLVLAGGAVIGLYGLLKD